MQSWMPITPSRSLGADPGTAFHEFVPFNDGHFAVFPATGEGAGPWEMHPDTDELLFALEGSVTIEPSRSRWQRTGTAHRRLARRRTPAAGTVTPMGGEGRARRWPGR